MTAKQRPVAVEGMEHAQREIKLLEQSFRERVEKLYDLVIRHDNRVSIDLPERLNSLSFMYAALCGRRRAAEEFQKIVLDRKRRRKH